jgi:hypothetical protein
VTAPATVRSLHNTIACSHFNRSGASPFFTFDKTWDYLSASQSRLGSHVPSQPVDLASFGFVVMNIDLLSQECVGHSIAFSNAWTSSPASKPLKIGHGRGMCLCTSVIFHHRVHTTSERCQRIHIWSCFFGGGPKYSVFIQIVSYIETQFVVFICRLEDYARKTANVAFESCCLGRLQNGHPQSPREPRIETYQDSPECVLTLYI